MTQAPDWSPFQITVAPNRGQPPRALDTFHGVGDRLRAAAFAEIQAREAFLWAEATFSDTPAPLKQTWRALSSAEDRHLGWLLKPMEELKISVTERTVSDQLWRSLISCKTAEEFSVYMASAEERGRRAGERFHQALLATDPVTAEIFGKIAEEEVAHIALAARYYPEAWGAYIEAPTRLV